MPSVEKPQSEIGLSLGPEYIGFDHITWYVGNARQAASYYVSRMNFNLIGYKGPETGSPHVSSYIVENGLVRFVFVAPVCAPPDNDEQELPESELVLLREIHEHLTKHGDGVKDIAFRVNAVVKSIWDKAVKRGAVPVNAPAVVRADAPFDGEIQMATIGAYGDTTHTFINRETYNGPFLPGYQVIEEKDPINRHLPEIDFVEIDHCVGNQPWDGVDKAVKFYEECLDFHRYWTIDDTSMCSDFSAMRSIVIASQDDMIKMPLNEPAVGKKKSQIEEFVDYYNGPGVQHIAFRTTNIIAAVTNLRERGMQFLSVPDTYYIAMRQKLNDANMVLNESIDLLQKLHILVDFSDEGYLLQIFAKHVLDRPTVFIEIIQRNNFDGFGAGNFKALFEAFEREQALRGNL
ncbi:4-hydroxyphenylpyruvate dioxygenase [Emydomyces testavorans]|uniref:4-hydroxyphenylpyruvate dioxygenase n=1 Tax=Emydomyces testavorans TaxID=2070801 RepID=A0AAF0INH7_9EURO|nr:4-hydroxyphenylpyruvate dioxygenase [Emydomyces testavorans]